MDMGQLREYEEAEIKLLKEWLPKISGENRAYIKGVTKALLYAQEIQGVLQGEGICKNKKSF